VTSQPQTLVDLFMSVGERMEDEIAWCYVPSVGDPVSITGGELIDQGLRIAAGLHDRGIKAGSPVVLIGRPLPSWVASFVGIIFAGAIPVPMNVRTKFRELERVVAASGATSIVTDDDLVPEGSALAQRLQVLSLSASPSGNCVSIRELLDFDPVSPVKVRAKDPAVALQTSGTSGTPKCVLQSHRSYAEFAAQWASISMVVDDRILSYAPLNHQSALLMSWLAGLSKGCPTFQLDRFTVEAFWSAVREHRLTWSLLMQPVPTYLLNSPPRPDDREHTLRWALGNVSTLGDWEKLQDRFGFPFHCAYGATETTVVATTVLHNIGPVPRSDILGPLGGHPSGVILPIWQARLVDESGAEVGPLTPGELEVKGPGIFSAYLNDDAATIAAFTEDGWFRTGDRLYRREDGFFYFLERIGTTIRRSGENIAVAEVEAALLEHPAIAKACVIAAHDPLRGQEVRACLELELGMTVSAEEIYEHCAARLTDFKVPRYLDIWEALPMTVKGDVARHALDSDPNSWIDRAELPPRSMIT
jgi:carnitine-CoA ligase